MYKRQHLSRSQSNEDAWEKSLEHTLQYCRHTFSPGTWRKVRSNVMRICDDEEREVHVQDRAKSRDKKMRARELRAVKELVRNRAQGKSEKKSEKKRFESMTVHR